MQRWTGHLNPSCLDWLLMFTCCNNIHAARKSNFTATSSLHWVCLVWFTPGSLLSESFHMWSSPVLSVVVGVQVPSLNTLLLSDHWYRTLGFWTARKLALLPESKQLVEHYVCICVYTYRMHVHSYINCKEQTKMNCDLVFHLDSSLWVTTQRTVTLLPTLNYQL